MPEPHLCPDCGEPLETYPLNKQSFADYREGRRVGVYPCSNPECPGREQEQERRLGD